MKKYDSYKDSNIEWIGEIPNHWDAVKIKYLSKEPDSLFIDGDWIESKVIVDEGIRYITTGNIKVGYYSEQGSGFISEETFEELNCTEVFEGDLVISRLNNPIGRACIIPNLNSRIVTSVDNVIFRPDSNVNKFFLLHLFSSKEYFEITELISRGATMQRISRGLYGNIKIPLPPLKEQNTIANFLNKKTTQIDHLIAKKEQFINLLQEERTAVINQAVTKGLDPKVKMKDSGIEWLGEIPEHWEVKKLKYFANVVLGKMLTNEDKGGYLLKPYLRAKNIEWINPNIEDVKEMWFSENEVIQFRIKENDLLVSEGGEVGRTCIWRNQLVECYIQNSVHKVTILEGEPNYFLNQIVLFGKYGHFDAIVNKISIAHLTKEKLKDVAFIVPSIDEQSEISKFITNKTLEIDSIIFKSNEEIELLKEYKTALISEVVTGKMDVRNEVVN